MVRLFWTEKAVVDDRTILIGRAVDAKKLWVFENGAAAIAAGTTRRAMVEFRDGSPTGALVARLVATNRGYGFMKAQEAEVFHFDTNVYIVVEGNAIIAVQTMGNPTGP